MENVDKIIAAEHIIASIKTSKSGMTRKIKLLAVLENGSVLPINANTPSGEFTVKGCGMDMLFSLFYYDLGFEAQANEIRQKTIIF